MSRILVVDDEAVLRKVFVTALQHLGHTVMQAEEGEQALQLLQTSPADLVLLDIVMPGREGIETLIAIRQAHPGTAVVAMSGAHFSETYLTMARQLGASRVLTKPFSLDQLSETIAQMEKQGITSRNA